MSAKEELRRRMLHFPDTLFFIDPGLRHEWRKCSTPADRMDWLAAAVEFVQSVRNRYTKMAAGELYGQRRG